MHTCRRMLLMLALALALAPAVDVNGVMLSANGVGQVLLDPYYTVNDGRQTLLTLTNVSELAQVVRVRFRESYNGRRAAEFLLFLSPRDSWTGIVEAAPTGGALLRTRDRSCTNFATARNSALVFSKADYAPSGTAPGDPGPSGIERTREGFVEIIAAASIVPGSPTDAWITHIQTIDPAHPGQPLPNGGVPRGCHRLVPSAILADLLPPNASLVGHAAIVDAATGAAFTYSAQALTGFTDRVLPLDAGAPTLAHANSDESPRAARAWLAGESGRPFALDFDDGIDAVSAVLMAGTLANEVVGGMPAAARTDWIVTFPTKAFYVDKQRYPGHATAPFETAFSAPGISEAHASARPFDREEGTEMPPRCPIPPDPPNECWLPNDSIALRYQVNAIAFRDAPDPAPSDVLGGRDPANADPLGIDGWIELALTGYVHRLVGHDTGGAPFVLAGLPAVGFMASNAVDASTGHTSMVTALPHRTSVYCHDDSTGLRLCR